MALLRRLIPVLAGAAVGCAALAVAKHYNDKNRHGHTMDPEAFDDVFGSEDEAPEDDQDEDTTPEVYIPAPDHSDPNPNPVRDHTDPVPTTEDGKLDPTCIARPEDFADWDEMGCQG